MEHADDIVCDSPDADVVDGFEEAKPDGLAWTQLPVAYDEDDEVALDAARLFAFGAPGWKVMAEVPSAPDFDAVAELVDDDTIRELVTTGSDPGPLVDRIRQAADTGYDRVSVVQVGPQRTEQFQRWWTEQVASSLP